MSVVREELLRILDQLDPEALQSVLRDLHEGAYCQKSWRDVSSPGEEYRTGEDGLVTTAQLADIERVVEDANFLPVSFLEEGAKTQRAVGRIALTTAHAGLPAGSGWGTGSLVSSSLLLTNNHVLPTVGMARNTRVEFNYQLALDGSPETVDAYAFDPDRLFVTDRALDYTLVRVRCKQRWVFESSDAAAGPEAQDDPGALTAVLPNARLAGLVSLPGSAVLPVQKVCPGSRWGHLRLPSRGVQYAHGQYVNIVQHPKGRRKEVALQENRVTNVYNTMVRYRTDTEPGSSGSPVFDNSWELVALHHAAGEQSQPGVWINNEGIRIDKIVADLRAKLAALAGGAAVLTELGL